MQLLFVIAFLISFMRVLIVAMLTLVACDFTNIPNQGDGNNDTSDDTIDELQSFIRENGLYYQLTDDNKYIVSDDGYQGSELVSSETFNNVPVAGLSGYASRKCENLV